MKDKDYETNILDINSDFYIVQVEQDDGKWVGVYHDVAYTSKNAAFNYMNKHKKLYYNDNCRVVKCRIERTVIEE